MRTSLMFLAVLLRSVTGWSDSEDWSYEEWSDGWQHGVGSAQEGFYAEPTGDTNGLAEGLNQANEAQRTTATEPPRVTGRISGGYSISGGKEVSSTGVGVTDQPSLTEAPYFARQSTQVVSAVGHNVTFQCRVLNIGEKEVIWMRSRDLHILAVGAAVFSGDTRVSATQHDASRHDATQRDRTHNLTITRLRPSDAGKYECQLNTDPKKSLYFNLTVLPMMPQIELWVTGGGAVREGSVAVLRCAARVVVTHDDAAQTRGVVAPVTHRDAAPVTHAIKLALRWYKDGEPVDLQSEGGVSVQSYGGAGVAGERAPWRRSVLRVRHVTATREGRYECRAAPNAVAHAHLTVLSGRTTEMWVEGMQRDQAAVSASRRCGLPAAPLPRAVTALVLAALLAALAGRALLECTGGLRELQY